MGGLFNCLRGSAFFPVLQRLSDQSNAGIDLGRCFRFVECVPNYPGNAGLELGDQLDAGTDGFSDLAGNPDAGVSRYFLAAVESRAANLVGEKWPQKLVHPVRCRRRGESSGAC